MRRASSIATVRLVYALYALSGFVSLGYQVGWFRLFVDRFGSTNLTFVLVICNFIGGIGAGALASRPLTARLSRLLGTDRPLRVYGALELLVAVSSLMVFADGPLMAAFAGSFPYVEQGGILVQTAGYQAARIAIATLCIFIPCFFMGMTFPLLCHAFRERIQLPAALYAWNTLGACSAVLVAEFLLLPHVGHTRTFLAMAAVNGALGLFFLSRPDGLRDPVESLPSEQSVAQGESLAPLSFLLTGAFASGLLCGAAEGDMFKRLSFLGCNVGSSMAFISFWAILAIFLASWTVRVTRMGLFPIKAAYVLAGIYYLVVWYYKYPLREWVHAEDIVRVRAATAGAGPVRWMPFEYGPRAVLLYSGLFVLPAYYLTSLLLPYVCIRAQASRRHLGLAYGLNTLAFCAGMIGFTWIAPSVNIFYSTKLFVVFFAVVVVLVIVLSERRPVPWWLPLGALGATAAAALFVPVGFDREYFWEGHPARTQPVRALKSNGAHTTYVVESPGGPRLFFDSYSMSGTDLSAQRYMRMMAHVPLLLHPQPRSALLICFGVGNTASAIAAHEEVEQLDIVDLNLRVFETGPEFAATNDGVLRDPRVRLIYDDGRSYLRLCERRYDLITSEPPPPMHEGVYRLYTEEYYQAVASRLTDQGFMTQWLPLYQMSERAAELIISTFLEVFPHTLLFLGELGGSNEFILVGSKAEIDVTVLERRIGEFGNLGRELDRMKLPDPLSFVAFIVRGDASLREEFAGRGILSDQHNDLARQHLDYSGTPRIAYDPGRTLEEIGAERLKAYPAVHGLVHSEVWKGLIEHSALELTSH